MLTRAGYGFHGCLVLKESDVPTLEKVWCTYFKLPDAALFSSFLAAADEAAAVVGVKKALQTNAEN